MNYDLKKMDFDFLKEVRMVQFTNLVTLQLANNPAQADQVNSLEGYVEKLDAEIKRRREEDEKGQKPNISTEVSTAKDYTSHKIKSMCNVIATEIPVFSSGHDVHTWLSKLESYYKLYVVPDTTGIMEEHFVQSAKSRLCAEYLHSMLATSDATDKFEDMKVYMKKNHASKMSVFQTLDTLWEMSQTDSESFRDYGIRLDDKAAEADNIIIAKFKEFAESTDGKSDESEMKSCDIFKLVSGQVFLQELKNKHPVIYNNICNDLDKTWSAKEIALKAMTFKDRMTSSDGSQNQGSVPDAFAVQRGNNSNSNKSNNNKSMRNNNSNKNSKNDSRQNGDNICHLYLIGKCFRGNSCKYIHSNEQKAKVKSLLCEIKTGDKKGPESKPQGGNSDKNGKSGSKGNSQPASYAAAVGETPMVPLPTQNFRN